MGKPAPARVMLTIACVICALTALWFAFMTSQEVYFIGFPDGHITDYGHAVETPLRILTWVQAGFGLLFLALAFAPTSIRVRGVGLAVALVAFVLVVLLTRVGVPWYYGTRLGLDNGIGG